jgi:hypothetical protein
MVIDDLSVSLSKPLISDVTADSNGVNITWFSAPNKLYTVLFADELGEGQPDAAGNHVAPDSADGTHRLLLGHAANTANQGFYRVGKSKGTQQPTGSERVPILGHPCLCDSAVTGSQSERLRMEESRCVEETALPGLKKGPSRAALL